MSQQIGPFLNVAVKTAQDSGNAVTRSANEIERTRSSIKTTLNAVIKLINVDGNERISSFRYEVRLPADSGYPELILSASERHFDEMKINRALEIAKRRNCLCASIHRIDIVHL